MNKKIRFIIVTAVISILLIGCGTIDQNSAGNNGTDSDAITGTDNITTPNDLAATVTFQAEVMEVGQGLLISPDPKSDEYKSSDKISVNITGGTIKDINGKEITLKELIPGDIIDITYNGVILESYPAQIGASTIKVADHNILIDGYLAMIDDIYQVDPGLNGDIEMIAFDTTEWVGITDIEKEIILGAVKQSYSIETREATNDELAEEGLIDKEKLNFEKGILITISKMDYDKDKQEITYSIVKWRSGDGADGSDDAKASYNGTKWEIQQGRMWIS